MEKTVAAKPSNRRRSQRRKPRSSVKIECRRGLSGLGPNVAISVLDMSDTGVRLIVQHAFDLPVEVEINISSYGMNKPLRRVGAVRWQVKLENGSFCVGIEFQRPLQYRDWQNLASPG